MRITVKELFNVGQAFGDLVDRELPIKTALKLRRINKAIGVEVEIHDPERIKIFEKVGCEKNGNQFDLQKLQKEHPKKLKELESKLQEFYNQEIELNCKPLKVEDLGDIEVKPSSLILLERFIED